MSESFLNNIPETSVWRKLQMQAGLYDVMEYKRAVRHLIGRSGTNVEKGFREDNRHPETDIVARARTYALLTKSTLAGTTASKALSRFQALILLSLCAVLEKKGVAADTIDQIAQYVTDSGMDTRLRLRRSALWINSLIVELTKRGWDICRATELFFISCINRIPSVKD